MQTGLVSILIPYFNSSATIRETLACSLAQTWKEIEIIVVDDGSTNRFIETIEREFGSKVQFLRQQNMGPSAARNRALQEAGGEWVVFLDADDSLDHDFIEAQVVAAMSSSADICFGQSLLIWPSEKRFLLPAPEIARGLDFTLSRVLSDGWCPANAILWRAEFIRSVGGWNVGMRRNEDGEMIARALLGNPKVTASFGSRAFYRQHDGVGRVSARRDWSSMESQVAFCERLESELKARGGFPLAVQALARQAHELANAAYFLGFDDLGGRSELVARRDGPLQPLPRSALHRLGVRVFGMRNKQRLSRFLARVKALLMPRAVDRGSW